MTGRRRRPPALRRGALLGGALLATAALVGSTVTASGASWMEEEWAHGTVGVPDCATADVLRARAEGRFLGANVLGVPLPNVADIKGVVVEHIPPGPALVDPAAATALGGGAHANPLTVALLDDALTLDLTDVLTIPVSADTGALNQYGRADGTGSSTGASGLVNDSGGLVDLRGYEHPEDIPGAATLNLRDVVASVLGTGNADLVDAVAALDLEVGAVGSRARLDACSLLFGADLADVLDRDYLIASLDLVSASSLIEGLVEEVGSAVTALSGTLNGLSGNAGLVNGILGGVTGLLDGLLGALQLGTVNANLSAEYDFSAVNALLGATISDSRGLVSIDLAGGTVGVDLARLFGGAQGLNDQPPNTELLIDKDMLDALVEAVAEALGDWVDDVTAALDGALDTILLNGTVDVRVRTALGVDVISAGLVLTGASLGSLLDGTATSPAVVVNAGVLGAVTCPAPPLDVVSLLVCPLATGIINALVGGLPGVAGQAVMNLLAPFTTSLATTLDTLTATATSPLIRLVSALVGGLFGVDRVASVLLNAQNDPLAGGPEPGDWVAPAIPEGRYQVAAIRIGVLGLLGAGNDLDLVLAAGSVGVNGRP